MNYSAQKIIDWGTSKLKDAGVERPGLEAEYMLAFTTDEDRAKILAGLTGEIEPAVKKSYRENIKKRAKRIPAAYIFRYKNFMGYKFAVTEDTLIPRPETEILVEKALKYLKNSSHDLRVLDLGTGSGNIAVTIAKSSSAEVVATDISKSALDVARINAKRHKVEDKIKFIQSDLFSKAKKKVFGGFDLILSNPPYVKSEEYVKIQVEVKREPRNALVAGDGGLEIIKRILTESKNHIKKGGTFFIELGYEHRGPVKEFIDENLDYEEIEFIKDYSDKDRILRLKI